jgi:hypothetical protein
MLDRPLQAWFFDGNRINFAQAIDNNTSHENRI